MTTLDDLDALIKLALSEGALGAEVYLREATTHRIDHDGRSRVQRVKRKTTASLTVRVWVKGGRLGVMEGLPANGADLLGQALASTFESPEDTYAGPVSRLPSPPAGLSILDRRYDKLDDEGRIAVLDDLVGQVRADKRFTLTTGRYRDTSERRALVNSKGVRLEEYGTHFALEGAVEGKELKLQQHTASRSFASVASLPLGTMLIRRGASLLQSGRTLPLGPVRVVLPPLAMSRLLNVMGERFDPVLLESGGFPNPAGAGLSPRLHVVDDGALVGGLRSRSFDDRGVPPVPLTLLREGQVGGRFLTPRQARLLGTRPTGHCTGTGLQAGNLVMREGTRSINALLTEHGGPSLKLDDLDLSRLNLKTGKLDLRVNGIVMAANKEVGAMRDAHLVGNLSDLLTQVVEVCGDTDRIGHIDAASIIADGLHLAE